MITLPAQERFLALLDEHRKILYKVAGAYCRNPEDRRDLVQEIVVQLWRSFPRFDGRAAFSTWMYRIAMNVAISSLRAESRRERRTEVVDEPILEVLAADRGAPEDSSDDIRQLHRFIGELDPMNRALVILYLDGNGHEAIGSVLGISTSNVGTRIGRIKQRLREDFARAGNAGNKEAHHGAR